jgi:iron complex transport system ATP-binding protein
MDGDTGSGMVERSRLSDRDAARETGYLAQLSSAYFPFTVAETVMLGRYAHQKRGITASPSNADRETVTHALELCGVTGLAEERLSRLSGGQLQRVFLARAFAQDPSILLLDEPSNHLDLFYQLEILKAVKEWTGSSAADTPATAGIAVHHAAVGVFHDLSLALRFADTVLLLDRGEIADYGEPRAVLSGGAINKAYGMNVAEAMRDLLQNW